MNQGSVHEAMNFASSRKLPVLFIIENNGYSELTPSKDVVHSDKFYTRASAYGLKGVRIDGNSVSDVMKTVSFFADRARGGEGGAVIEMMTERLVGHYIGDAELYRSPGEVEAARTREPLVKARERLSTLGVSDIELGEVETSVREDISSAAAAALSAPVSDPATVKEHLYA